MWSQSIDGHGPRLGRPAGIRNSLLGIVTTKPMQVATIVKAVSFFLLLSIVVLGCGRGDVQRQHLRGKVTYQGRPVPAGLILFNPIQTEGKGGSRGGARIVQGTYDTQAKDGLAVPVGKTQVLVTGYSKLAESEESGPAQPLFQGYETSVEVTPETTTFDINIP